MKQALLGLLILLSVGSYGQNKRIKIKPTPDETEFIQSIFFGSMSSKTNGTFHYQSKIRSFSLPQNIKFFARDTIITSYRNRKATKPEPILILTSEEKRHIKSQLQMQDSLMWGVRIIPKEKRLSLAKHGSETLFTISKPVFLRNNSICIFEYFYECGNRCGYGKSAVYQRVEGKWQTLMIVYEWHS